VGPVGPVGVGRHGGVGEIRHDTGPGGVGPGKVRHTIGKQGLGRGQPSPEPKPIGGPIAGGPTGPGNIANLRSSFQMPFTALNAWAVSSGQ
jgi:hypothetical protein